MEELEKLKAQLLRISAQMQEFATQDNFVEVSRILDSTGKSHSCKNGYRFLEAIIYGRNPHDGVVHLETNPYQMTYLIAGHDISYETLQKLQDHATAKRKLGAKAFVLVAGEEI